MDKSKASAHRSESSVQIAQIFSNSGWVSRTSNCLASRLHYSWVSCVLIRRDSKLCTSASLTFWPWTILISFQRNRDIQSTQNLDITESCSARGKLLQMHRSWSDWLVVVHVQPKDKYVLLFELMAFIINHKHVHRIRCTWRSLEIMSCVHVMHLITFMSIHFGERSKWLYLKITWNPL